MKTIPQTFTKNGFNFRQIHRNGMVAVFERGKPGQRHHFETVVLKTYKGGKIPFKHPKTGDVTIYDAEAGEAYPSNEQWGVYGFTYLDQESALAKAERLALMRP